MSRIIEHDEWATRRWRRKDPVAVCQQVAALRRDIVANFEALDRITEDLAQLGPDAPAHLHDALLRRLDDAKANATRVRELFGPSLDEGVIPLALVREVPR